MCQSKAPTDKTAIAEQLAYLFWPCVGNDIEILGFTPQQDVADTASDQVGLVTGILQAIQDL